MGLWWGRLGAKPASEVAFCCVNVCGGGGRSLKDSLCFVGECKEGQGRIRKSFLKMSVYELFLSSWHTVAGEEMFNSLSLLQCETLCTRRYLKTSHKLYSVTYDPNEKVSSLVHVFPL